MSGREALFLAPGNVANYWEMAVRCGVRGHTIYGVLNGDLRLVLPQIVCPCRGDWGGGPMEIAMCFNRCAIDKSCDKSYSIGRGFIIEMVGACRQIFGRCAHEHKISCDGHPLSPNSGAIDAGIHMFIRIRG